MHDKVVERLFSLFTSSDRAVAMTGDLAEERELRGSIWFWLHAVSVTLALWRSAVMAAPLRMVALILAGLALLTPPVVGGFAAVFLVPQWIASPVGWVALALSWWSGAFWTGVTLVALAPRRGMAACTTLAVATDALLIAFGGPAVWLDPSNTGTVLFCAAGLLAPMMLLTGAAVARRRSFACSVLSQEQLQ
ncbi:hypothetical protein [Paludibaculum fermentans]|uniref:hypothetical protein n=1 Tax=Paludibaculum fermentans TaxID=1473598 RepID=UPI003EB9AE0A